MKNGNDNDDIFLTLEVTHISKKIIWFEIQSIWKIYEGKLFILVESQLHKSINILKHKSMIC